MICQHMIFPFVYFINRWKIIDKKLVILADAHHSECPPHMTEIREALSKRDYMVMEVFFDINRLSLWEGLKKMISFMAMYPRCKTVIICDYFLPVASCNKKKNTRVIQLWHGCGAFKKFGYSTKEDIPSGYRGNVFNNNDIITVSGEACVRFFSVAMQAGGRVFPVGVSHTDRLFRQSYIEQCRDRLRYEYPDSAGKRIVLWAPTFRGNAAKPCIAGEQYIDRIMSQDIFFPDVYIIKSPHPHLSQNNSGMTTDELVACADLLITDYSSVFFEFLLMNKPVVFFAPDYEEYYAKRGFYLDYEDLPGDIITGTDDAEKRLKEAIITALTSDPLAARRRLYKSEYMSGCDGYASSRIIDRYIAR